MPFIRLRGRSMLPTLRPGQLLWITTPPGALHRGDLVLVRRGPKEAGRRDSGVEFGNRESCSESREPLLIKRLIAGPGESVALRGARVLLNGNVLEEPYVSSLADLQPLKDAEWSLGQDEFVVLGDARDDSLDSRRFGPVQRSEVSGVVRWRLWPWTRFCSAGALLSSLLFFILPSALQADDTEIGRAHV